MSSRRPPLSDSGLGSGQDCTALKWLPKRERAEPDCGKTSREHSTRDVAELEMVCYTDLFVGDWLFVFPLCGFSLSLFCNSCVTPRKLHTPGIAEEHQRQETPTISPNDRQPAQLTDQAPQTRHYLRGSPGVRWAVVWFASVPLVTNRFLQESSATIVDCCLCWFLGAAGRVHSFPCHSNSPCVLCRCAFLLLHSLMKHLCNGRPSLLPYT